MDRASGLWLAAREVVFVAGYRRDEDLGFARGRDILRPQGSVDPRHPALEDIPNDWAVLYLDHPLPVRPVPLRPLPLAMGSGAHLMRAGYSQDRPHLLSLHDGCALLDRLDNDQVLVTDCDGTRGDSGSPLLLKQGKGVWIVGVTSAVAARGKPGSYAVHAAVFAGQIGKVK
jgi:protease YdgD